VSTVDLEGRTICIADAHRGDGKGFIVRADKSGRAIPERILKRKARCKLLHWREKKGVRLAADRAPACDLADVVNPSGFPQDPTGVWRNKPV